MVLLFDYSVVTNFESSSWHMFMSLKTTLSLSKNKYNANIQQRHILPLCLIFLIVSSSIVLIFVFPRFLSCAFRCSCVVCSDPTSLIETHTHTHTHTHTISLISFNVSTPKSLEAFSGRINYPGSHYTLNQGYQHVTRCFQKFSLPLSFKSPPLSFPLPIVYLDKGQNLNGKCLDLSLCYKRQG